MSRRSLLLRLGCTAALLIALTLAVAGSGLALIFERQLDKRMASELDWYLKTLAAQVRLDEADHPALDQPPPEPRFEQPYSGLYWQIDGPAASLRSRSLWDFTLAKTEPPRPDALYDTPGPEDTTLMTIRRTVLLADAHERERPVTLTVAANRADLAAEQRSFLGLLVPSLVALALLLAAAMAGLIHLALRPFRTLRQQLRAIHAGEARTLSGDMPDEVQPVVDDLNRLIAFQDAAVSRAQTQAGDLAHGLKTPLTILGATARDARDRHMGPLADLIDEQVEAMRRHVDRALARARAGLAAALGQHATDVGTVIAKTVRALRTLPHADALQWEIDIAEGVRFAGEEGDLTEILGNLLDNAQKWADRRVAIAVAAEGPMLAIRIEDDGPGMSDEETRHITRGRRWDESRPGTGFGLAIARELVEAYRGAIRFGRAPMGGLAIIVTLPRATRRPPRAGAA